MMATQAKPQSFMDRQYFPFFPDCPEEYSWDDRYLVEVGEGDGVNRKHWCLLGQIMQADTILRPRIVAKDRDGNSFVVAFYPNDSNDMPRLLKNFKVGNTIAIFYPVVHQFLDGTMGVRVEDTDEVSIIPLGLGDVLKMNDQVVQFTVTEATLRRCHGCGALKGKLNACGKCKLFHYCDKVCIYLWLSYFTGRYGRT
ncbi:hypothetical protein K445DRAFT_101230 [Daldinia sp. EC12]|nr:hypothetical protein K445DRAFT_101230 [Daldinia sp. EC12]